MTTKRQTILYWVLTALFLLPMAGSGLPELFGYASAQTAATIAHLGYPIYLPRILGLAKVLGAVAIVSGRSRTLKEWAYAGYTFNLLGAAASHLISGDGLIALLPITLCVLVIASYRLWVSGAKALAGSVSAA